MNHTLSTRQWHLLQDLFARAETLDASATAALIAQTRADDALVATSLEAMLSAHQRWQSRTSDAVQHLVETSQVSAVGARLGAYRLVSEIGRGGMGVVYLGERVDGQVQQQVAIKVLHTQNLDDNTRARFQREREILAGFDHPGIARLLDAGVSEAGEPYFVMEYLRGLRITEHCDAQRLSIRARLQLFLQVCDAVRYAHGQLILHRDIKSSNVLVDGSGEPRLIDFGIAKPLRDAGIGTSDDTQLAHRFFSPVNAAPEQIRGDAVAVTCDVYQLGTLLYELLCGQPLFDLHGKTARQIEELICDRAPRAPSDAAAECDAPIARLRSLSTPHALQRQLRGDLDAIILRCVRKEPASRYSSVEQLADDVQRHLDNLPVHGRRGGTGYRMRRFAQRNWRAMSVAGIALAGVAAFSALLLGQYRATVVERDKATTESKRAESVTEFLIDIFRNADPSTSTGPDMPIRTVLKRGEELIEERASMDAQTRARLLFTLSSININLSDLASAESLILRAVALLEPVSAKHGEFLAQLEQHASGVLMMRSKTAEATVMAERAVRRFDSIGADISKSTYAKLNLIRAPHGEDLSQTCSALESLLLETRQVIDEWPEAYGVVLKFTVDCRMNSADGLTRNVVELKDAIGRVSRKLGPTDYRPMQLSQRLAGSLIAQHRLDEASAVLREILPQQIRIYSEKSWPVAYTQVKLGSIAFQRHDYKDAERQYTLAYTTLLAVHGNARNDDTAKVSYALARIHDVGFDNRKKAREFYTTALETHRILDPHSTEIGLCAADLGVFMLRANDSQHAEPLLTEAATILAPSTIGGARARLALARIHADRNDTIRAAELLQQTEGAIAQVLEEDARFGPEIRELRARLRGNTGPVGE